jgi:ADP-ribose pyrophosphatase YjhB (NUDIX family)
MINDNINRNECSITEDNHAYSQGPRRSPEEYSKDTEGFSETRETKVVKASDKFITKYEKKKYFDVCNNCGKQGHTFKQCKNPITSFGVIVFRINPLQQREYLMIRRKDTLGYIDFMRGKYSASNQKYIFNMIEQMTIQEKYKLKKYTFDELWHDLWIEEQSLLSTEDEIADDVSTPSSLPTSLRNSSSVRYVDRSTEEDRRTRNVAENEVQAEMQSKLNVATHIPQCPLRGHKVACEARRPKDDDASTTFPASSPNATVLRTSTLGSSAKLGVQRNMEASDFDQRASSTDCSYNQYNLCTEDAKPYVRSTEGFGMDAGNVVETSDHSVYELCSEAERSNSTIYQTYKQEEMNSRDKFIYLTTKYIKDIPHQSNLLPYLQKISCKNTSRVRSEGSEAANRNASEAEVSVSYSEGRRRSPDEYAYEQRFSGVASHSTTKTPADIWESREDKGAISILHYLIELSIQNSYSEGCEAAELSLPEASESSYTDKTVDDSSRDEHSNIWVEPEWGFPKGRRNFQEKDYDCALREMTEETGYPLYLMKNMKNILPFDEIFLGSNYKSYKHRYYLMYMDYEDSLITDRYDKSEVSMMRWKTYEECLLSIRPYNLEKKRLIKNIEITLSNYFHTATGLPKTYSYR